MILLNVPLMALAMKGYSVLALFLITNLMCCCAAIPVALGLLRGGNTFFTETGMIVGILSGIIGVRHRSGAGAGRRGTWAPPAASRE